MVLGISVVFLGLVLAVLYVAAQRAVTIAELVIDAGSVRVVRGGLAAAVLVDLGDVAHERSPAPVSASSPTSASAS